MGKGKGRQVTIVAGTLDQSYRDQRNAPGKPRVCSEHGSRGWFAGLVNVRRCYTCAVPMLTDPQCATTSTTAAATNAIPAISKSFTETTK